MAEQQDLFIVGMGASAGGLETFRKFLKAMPADSGLAFVLVQHLHPHHESLMPELLAKSTAMPVFAAQEGMVIAADHVYVIPANTTLTVENGRLHLEQPSESRGHRMPIDQFFKSLSEDCGERAICVVLSGTGSDGTLGLKAVKEHGGLAVAQNPESAAYDSMPRSAINTGLVDLVLDVREMPDQILKFLAKARVLSREIEEDSEMERHLDTIFAELEERTEHEFDGYKRNTILRRIRRRMQILQFDSLADYVARVREDGQEARLLFKDLLIGVTHFFRDAASFDYLRQKVVGPLLAEKAQEGGSAGLRIWVPGCATGEEAYTLALIVREEAAKIKASPPVQIFATDIDENALAVARRGSYPEGIEEQVPERHLERFFLKHGSTYQVNKQLREMCIFSPHNLISNPPYSRIDLIACRNLLIYFDSPLQRRVLPVFHYSLNSGGYLFLGPSENISARPELFRTVSRTHKIFQAQENVPPAPVDFPVGRKIRTTTSVARQLPPGRQRKNQELLAKAFERKVLEQYVPFSAVLNESGDVLYWAGPQAKYLEHPRGVPRSNLLEILHKSLRLPLRSVLNKVLASGEKAVQDGVVFQSAEGLQRLRIELAPFTEIGADSDLFFLVLRELGPPRIAARDENGASASGLEGEEINRQLEEELRDTKAYLQATIEELESSNEELKSSNEELLSMNQELQSSNEELQTSQEELQSANEELETVNTELKSKVHELDQANSDLQNLYESTRIASIFLDNDLHIKDFTPAATELFRLIESDCGRSIEDIVSRFADVDLSAKARQVLDRLEKFRGEVSLQGQGRHFIMQIIPYRTVNNSIDGVTVSFLDVTELKRAKEELEIRGRMLRLITGSVPMLIAYVDREFRYRYCNSVYQEWFGLNEEQVVGKTVAEVIGRRSFDKIRPQVEKALAGETVEFTTTLDFLHDGEKIVTISYEPHLSDGGEVCGFIACVQDESERILRERKLGRLAAIVNTSHSEIIGKDSRGVVTDWNRGAEELYGYTAEEAVGRHIFFIVPEERQAELEEAMARLRRGETVAPFETERLTKQGTRRQILLSLASIRGESGEYLGISAVAHDISDRVAAKRKLAELNETLERRVEKRTRQLHHLTARFLSLEQRERKKFSKYLHDEIQQTLAAAKLLVEQASTRAEDEERGAPLSESLRLLSEAIQNTRSITMDLSPPLFFDSGMNVCLQWLTRWARAKLGLEVATEIGGEERAVAEEAGYLLFRTLRELLFNIRKHAEVDAAEISLEFKGDGSLEVMVADEGRGFDPATLRRESTEQYGILSIIEQVRAMTGTISIDSVVGRGTGITIGLPAEVLQVREEALPSAVELSEELTGENRERMSEAVDGKTPVLIVDDQEDLRYTLRLMLEEIADDYVFLEAGDAAQALDMVREFKPALVLMDVSMPGMSGVEATEKIKEAAPEVAVIGLSMHEREDMEQAMRQAGAADYLTKDSSPEAILTAVKRLLQK